MAINAIEPGETKLIIPNDDTNEYYATLSGASVQLGRTKEQAENANRSRAGPAGDRGPLQAEENEEVWVHNPETNDSVAYLSLDHNGFWWTREARETVNTDAYISSAPDRNLGKTRLMDQNETLIDPINQRDAQPVTDATSAAGSGSSAYVELGPLRKDVDLAYTVSAGGDIVVEVSKDGNTWREFSRITVPDGGGADVYQYDTAYSHARVYADSNQFADGDVDVLEISSKGVS